MNMKNKNILKNVGVLLVAAVMVFSTTVVAVNIVTIEKKNMFFSSDRGNTLISDNGNNRVIEIDANGNIVWEITEMYDVRDAERLDNGITLISDTAGRVIEVDENGTIVWEIIFSGMPCDVERLDNGNTLIVEFGGAAFRDVVEVDVNGSVVWELIGLCEPLNAERLNSGNTLISACWVIEVDINGTIVWEKTDINCPYDVERLDNGNTLIANSEKHSVIEVDFNNTLVWEKTGLNFPCDAERLDNGNTLIADTGNDRVIEVDVNGTIVWEKTGFHWPFDVERINRPPYKPVVVSPLNGASNVDVDVELIWTGGDPDPGNTVTYDVYLGSSFPLQYLGTTGPHPGDPSYEVTYIVEGLDFFTTYYWQIVATDNHGASNISDEWSFTTFENFPPGITAINGPTSGKVGNTYSYTFVAVDPNDNDVFYEIDWGDGQLDPWDGPHESNTVIVRSHSWVEPGTFKIKARAKDEYDAIGEWGTLDVTMPKNKAMMSPLHSFLQNHPNLFPILRCLLEFQ